ncbi:MAG: tRNA (adenosine(37)-N6)-dimethylallyltransferase MiaA [Holosporales bacterium]
MMPKGIVIVGPTASGKSALALQIAKAHQGIIFNADSLQIYKGLPLLTAQPSAQDCAQVPHHLYGVLTPDRSCSAGHWLKLLSSHLLDLQQNSHLPIVVGGTGLYIQTLVEGLPPIPEVPEEIRARLLARVADEGLATLYEELKTVDPICAAKYAPQDTQRITRALEIFYASHKPLSHWQQQPRQKLPWEWQIMALMPPRDLLEQRAKQRLEAMIDHGVVGEVQTLLHHYPDGGYLSRALGFQAFAAHVRGEIALDEALQQAMLQTRQYIKRQYTWFRGQLKNPFIFNKIYSETCWDEIKVNFLQENAE